MGLRGMRVRKIPLVRVLYAEATRPFPVNAKGAGPQTTFDAHWIYRIHVNADKPDQVYYIVHVHVARPVGRSSEVGWL